LPLDASVSEIKKTYLVLARRLHPDINGRPDANEKFIEVDHAYKMLSDSKSRWLYDSGQIKSDGQEREVDPVDAVMETMWRQMMWEQHGSARM